MSANLDLERPTVHDAVEPHSRTLELPDGLRLNALHWPCAAPSGRSVILVHGLGDTAWVWDGIAPALARHAQVVAIELRGHGRSDRGPANGYDCQTMAADLQAAVDRLGFERPFLVGHSLGAALVMRAAAQSPARFAGVALLDYATEVPTPSLALVRGVIARLQETHASIDAYAGILRRRHPLAPPGLVERVARGALEPVAGGFRPRFDAQVLRTLSIEQSDTAHALLGRLASPVLFVRGALSWMVTPQAAERMAAACPAAHSAVVAMAGHSVQIDSPAGTLRALEPFLATPDGPR